MYWADREDGTFEIIDGQQRTISVSDGMKQKVFEKQAGLCVKCQEVFTIREMEADHIKPWIECGKTSEDNCQMLCRQCNRVKSAQ